MARSQVMAADVRWIQIARVPEAEKQDDHATTYEPPDAAPVRERRTADPNRPARWWWPLSSAPWWWSVVGGRPRRRGRAGGPVVVVVVVGRVVVVRPDVDGVEVVDVVVVGGRVVMVVDEAGTRPGSPSELLGSTRPCHQAGGPIWAPKPEEGTTRTVERARARRRAAMRPTKPAGAHEARRPIGRRAAHQAREASRRGVVHDRRAGSPMEGEVMPADRRAVAARSRISRATSNWRPGRVRAMRRSCT